ncbi:hypothetical protein COCSUDRAFT_34600 [Coccomyxa subellipsoidea C-169]|uniref:Uncharacterized protein n=1 Tax=Coccomyxa subellipsoidea (strain C-169) TaxID=574566 RepID=I0YIA8_COCSC|nr:hypothetical protein COCSUDRAFT_34600 [Coccomyxa subellipsoidea C-169]EIE18127.1 hypothetical protein COCSUDRAFT_34600 [Coccomyxa subellipsoidea C-169]|eukprot:XP_005642671.1 hypothetical protein COCSUDRAFT_34600 [Coccomyxa subellipsoidea C-169]
MIFTALTMLHGTWWYWLRNMGTIRLERFKRCLIFRQQGHICTAYVIPSQHTHTAHSNADKFTGPSISFPLTIIGAQSSFRSSSFRSNETVTMNTWYIYAQR